MIKEVKAIYEITTVCPLCGKESTVLVEASKYEEYKEGKCFAQDLGLNPDEAELLISGTCNECWEKMFSEKEE